MKVEILQIELTGIADSAELDEISGLIGELEAQLETVLAYELATIGQENVKSTT